MEQLTKTNVYTKFMIYHDGVGNLVEPISSTSTHSLGLIHLDFDEKSNVLNVWLRRPGLLIGKHGEDIDRLKAHLGCEIAIHEVNRLDAEIKLVYKKDKIFPTNNLVRTWMFNDSEESEALLANQIAVVAQKNGMNQNDLVHLIPAILRMLKSNSEWAK